MPKGYYLPTKIYFGSGISKHLSDILEAKGKRVCLVVDPYILKQGIAEKIKASLPGTEVKVISEIEPNPTITQVEKTKEAVKEFGAELVIAIGGGSTLDTGKSAAILSQNEGALLDFLQKKRGLLKKGLLFTAIPTTAGTGSEISPYATIWADDKTKYSLSSTLMFPSWAICDPELTLSLPPFLTASTGMDALSQAIEAYWSIHSTSLSDVHAQRAISLVVNNLREAVKNPHKLFYREKMMLAALEAGRAFSQTATTAVHSVSYPMTAYFNIPHGYACALTLSSFLQYNCEVTTQDCNDKRGPEFVRKRIRDITGYLGCNTVDNACLKINNLMKSVGLETSLSKAGISDIETVVEHGFSPDRVSNNPRLVTKESLKELLENIY